MERNIEAGDLYRFIPKNKNYSEFYSLVVRKYKHSEDSKDIYLTTVRTDSEGISGRDEPYKWHNGTCPSFLNQVEPFEFNWDFKIEFVKNVKDSPIVKKAEESDNFYSKGFVKVK